MRADAAGWPDPPNSSAYYSLAGDFVAAIEPHTESDPTALLVQFLAAFGNIVGRRAYFEIEAVEHYPVLFTVVVGNTAKGRKGTAWSHVRNILGRADEDWAANRVQGGLSSGEGLIQAVQDDGPEDKRLLIVEPEFASVLRVMERQGNTISAMLRQAWDTGDIRTLTRKPLHATGTHISLIGHITRDELRVRLNSTEAANGFGNRILWCCAKRSKVLPHGGRLGEESEVPLVNMIRKALKWLHGKPCPLRLGWDHSAKQLWEQVYEDLSEGKPGMFGAVTSRAEAYVVRLALAYAVLDQCSVIEKDHLLAALAVWKYCEASAKFIFGDASGDPIADTILNELRARQGGITRTEISEIFSHNRSASVLDSALGQLAAQGRAKPVRDPRVQGRAAERWIAV